MENRTDTWPTHADVRAASGRVEGARNVITPPDSAMRSSCGCGTTHIHGHHHALDAPPSRIEEIKTRGLAIVDDLKSRSMETADTLRREAAIRTQQLKSSMADVQVTARREMDTQVLKMQRSMRSDPMMWAGIAAGSGMVLGLIGRYVHWRATRKVPVLIIQSC